MIGQMRDKITFRSPVAVSVGGGGVETTYSDTLTDWAKAEPVRSTVDIEAYKTSIGKLYRFTVRYRAGFTPSVNMLVSFDNRLFAIAGIEEVKERQRYWRITAAERS